MDKVFYYEPHRHVVEDFIRSVGGDFRKLRPIQEDWPHATAGIVCGTVLLVDEHPRKMSGPVTNTLMAQGFIFVRIQDCYARQRYFADRNGL